MTQKTATVTSISEVHLLDAPCGRSQTTQLLWVQYKIGNYTVPDGGWWSDSKNRAKAQPELKLKLG